MPDTPRGSGEDSREKAFPKECEFKFIADPEVRGALQRYYRLSLSTFEKVCYQWTVIFAGRAIETILLDLFDLDRSGALLVYGLITNRTLALKRELDTSRWDSMDLISVAVDRGLVPRSATRLFDPFKGCKNGPNGIEEWKEVAKIALEVLITLDRKLS